MIARSERERGEERVGSGIRAAAERSKRGGFRAGNSDSDTPGSGVRIRMDRTTAPVQTTRNGVFRCPDSMLAGWTPARGEEQPDHRGERHRQKQNCEIAPQANILRPRRD